MTFTCEPGLIMAVCMNHGSPRQIRMSKTFEPTAFETAMSPYLAKGHVFSLRTLQDVTYPSFMTAMLDRASGTDTPAATKVNPMSVSGTPRVLPMIVIIQTMMYE